jgi:hypothetical protein
VCFPKSHRSASLFHFVIHALWYPVQGDHMNAVAITIGASWTLAGLLIIASAIPLARRSIGRNRFYGIRLPESYRSDDAWYAINQYGGKRLILWAFPLVLVGIACFFLPLRAHSVLTIMAGLAPLLFVFVPAIEAWRFARKYERGE